MIIFLTLIYIAFLLLLRLCGIIRFNLFWTLSPIVWVLLLFVVLFIPMQWGAPVGPVEVFSYTIEIVPAVTGQVVDVPVQPLTKIKKGDVLFQIDPEPFEREVKRLEAALVDAKQQPALLANAVQIAEAKVSKATAQQTEANKQLERSRKLLAEQAGTQVNYENSVRNADIANQSVAATLAELSRAKLQQAAATSKGENTAIAQARELLERARYDLDHSTVRAPSDGVVQQLALRPGARVAALPLRSSLVFVESNRSRISMAINQNQLRYVKAGQPAEIVLKYLPGMTLKAEVVGIAAVTSGGQVQTSGVVEDLSSKQRQAVPVQVVLTLTDDRVDINSLPGGVTGIAAVYTTHVTFAHVVRRVMLRMKSWLNYIY